MTPEIEAWVEDRLKPLKRRLNQLEGRATTLEARDAETALSLADILDLFEMLDARVDALEGGTPEEPEEPPVEEPEIEFRRPADFAAADLRENANPTGPHTLTEPALIEYHDDGTATLHAEQRLDRPGYQGRTYYSGSLVTRTPLHFAKGLFGGIVHLKGRAVGALFAYGSSGKEIDFEATYLLGEAGWSPNLWMPKQGGKRYSAGTTAKRILRRVPVTDTPQALLARLLDDRCEFYHQTFDANLDPAGPLTLFETITPADFPADVIWDTTTADMAIFTAIEWHGTWAGWGADDYAQPASMRVYGITPGAVDVDLSPEVTIPDTPPTIDATARTVDGIAWAFAATGGGQAGFLPDGKTIGLARAADGTGSNSAKATFPTQPGKLHRFHFGTRGQISVNGAGAGWAGLGSGNHVREWTPIGTSETVTFTNNAGSLRYVGGVRLEVVGTEEPPVEPEPPVTATGSVGAGLEGLVDWTTEQPLADVLKTSRYRQGADGSANYMVLTELPRAMTSAAGRYRLKHSGKGTLRVNGGSAITLTGPGERWIDYQPTGGGILNLSTTPSDAADPLTLLSLVHESNVAAYDAGETFNLRYLERITGLTPLRFMDWQRINGSNEARWSERMTLDRASYAGWPGDDPGAPLELCIDLANRTGADGWFCIPHLADDAYVEQAATVIRDRLNPKLRAYIEYSNEYWNYAGPFAQTRWVEAQGRARWPNADIQSARAQWGAGRTVQIARIFERVFGSRDRFRIVLTGHTANTWMGGEALTGRDWRPWDAANGGDGRPVSDRVDAYAVAGYFGYGIGNNGTLANLIATQGVNAAVDAAIAILNREVEGLVKTYADNKALADQHGLDLVMYEGGLHSNPTGGRENDAAYLDMLFRVHRDPRMGPLYRRWLDIWKAAGGKEMCLFVAIGRWTKHGMWGHLEHLDDDSARWQAITAWRDANPVWW